MLNFVATLGTAYFATGPWRDPQSSGGVLLSRPLSDKAHLPSFEAAGRTFSLGLIVSAAAVAALGLVFGRTLFGYRATIIGSSARTGAYAGMNVRRNIVGVLLLSGAVAGLAGGIELSADVHSFSPSLSNNTGYIGIGIGALAAGSFTLVFVLGVAIAGVLAVSESAQLVGIPSDSVFLIVGAMLLATALGDALARYRVVRRDDQRAPVSTTHTAAQPESQ
jgi:simple sugar transport system permease protein